MTPQWDTVLTCKEAAEGLMKGFCKAGETLVAMQGERKASAQEWSENRWMEGSNGDLSMYRGELSMLGGKTRD